MPLLVAALLVASGASAQEAGPAEMLTGEPRPHIVDAAESDAMRRANRTGGQSAYDVVGENAVIQGDVLIGRVDEDGRIISNTSVRGFGSNRMLERWPDGIVPYEFDVTMNADQRQKVQAAIEHWMVNTRITFAARGTERADVYENYLRFIPEEGCASYVGRAQLQPQPLYVQNCTVGSIIHELGHAIGLYHEHTRPDRDGFIEVVARNIVSGRERNFDKVDANAQPYREYDYGSIMHYGDKFFSNNGEKTIKAPQGVAIGQRTRLSEGDAASVDRMYATDLDLAVTSRTASLVDADGATVDGLEIEVAVRNLGSLGAHDLAIDLSIGEEADWLSVTEDSGWNCLTREASLRCSRDTLAENQSTAFTLHLDPKGHDADDLAALLTSRTLDLDSSNNGLNDDDAEALPTAGAAQPKAEGDSTSTQTSGAEPSSGAGGSTTTKSSGGAFAPIALLTLVAVALMRRRRKPVG